MKSCHGYTLGELMLVVAIISLLASILEPKIVGQIILARESVVMGDLGSVRGAVSIYYANTEGFFPNDLNLGLTAGAQYMSALPYLSVPEVDAQDNPGFNATNQVISGDGTTPAFGVFASGVDGGYYFINSGGQDGNEYVDWPYNDTKGQPWSLK